MPQTSLDYEGVGQIASDTNSSSAVDVAGLDNPNQLKGDPKVLQDYPQARPMNAVIGLLLVDIYMPRGPAILPVLFIELPQDEDVVDCSLTGDEPGLVVPNDPEAVREELPAEYRG